MLGNEPRTLEQAQKYRYTQWAGNPKGNTYRPERCAMEVWSADRGALPYQCCRKPGYGPANLYCKQHAKKLGA